MAEIFSLRPSEHEIAQKLLPWYVNGTLDGQEAQRMDAHLAECADCREDLAAERTLARGVAMLPLNPEDGWKAMEVLMANHATQAARGPLGLLRRRVPVGWAAVGSLAASIAIGVVIAGLKPAPAAQQVYHTLGSPPAKAGGQLVVLFKPDTTEQQMRVILAAQHARVVDGPAASGAYVLRIDGGDLAGAIPALRASSQVVLAEPLASDGRP